MAWWRRLWRCRRGGWKGERAMAVMRLRMVLAEEAKGCDVLVVAHGHSLRAFVKRWLKLELGSNVELMLEPGGVCGLSYAHGNVEERAALVGMSFPPAVENPCLGAEAATERVNDTSTLTFNEW